MTAGQTEHKNQSAGPADELTIFRKQDEIIAQLKQECSALTVNGVTDNKGLKAVHEARMRCVAARTSLDKTRKKMNEDAQEHIRKINGEAKRLLAQIEPIESRLENMENEVTKERERIKCEAEESRKAKIKQRYEAIQAAGYTGDIVAVMEMTDEAFVCILAAAKEDKEHRDRLAEEERHRQSAEVERLRKLEADAAAERAKQEAEAAEKRKAEQAAMAVERERLAAIQRQQEAEAERLRAEQQRIADQQESHRRAVELEQAKAEAAERARVELERRMASEQAEAKAAEERKAAKEKAEAEAREAARLKAEQERPHREKLLAVADAVGSIQVPIGPRFNEVLEVLRCAAAEIRTLASGSLK